MSMPESQERPLPLFELRCSACGYGVSVRIAPEACPMCGGGAWELFERAGKRHRPETDPPIAAR